MTLKELQQSNPDLYETDKGSHWHSFAGKSYLDHYETHLGPLRDAPGDILEIGVHHGGSVRMWRDYFSQGVVFGLDCLDVSRFQKSEGRIVICQGDQAKPTDLGKFSKLSSGFKFIVDDGSHDSGNILVSLDFLWSKVLPGGVYAVEDLQRPMELGTHVPLVKIFNVLAENMDRRIADLQAIHRYAHLILFQKVG